MILRGPKTTCASLKWESFCRGAARWVGTAGFGFRRYPCASSDTLLGNVWNTLRRHSTSQLVTRETFENSCVCVLVGWLGLKFAFLLYGMKKHDVRLPLAWWRGIATLSNSATQSCRAANDLRPILEEPWKICRRTKTSNINNRRPLVFCKPASFQWFEGHQWPPNAGKTREWQEGRAWQSAHRGCQWRHKFNDSQFQHKLDFDSIEFDAVIDSILPGRPCFLQRLRVLVQAAELHMKFVFWYVTTGLYQTFGEHCAKLVQQLATILRGRATEKCNAGRFVFYWYHLHTRRQLKQDDGCQIALPYSGMPRMSWELNPNTWRNIK